jgi:hypothetical protein
MKLTKKACHVLTHLTGYKAIRLVASFFVLFALTLTTFDSLTGQGFFSF